MNNSELLILRLALGKKIVGLVQASTFYRSLPSFDARPRCLSILKVPRDIYSSCKLIAQGAGQHVILQASGSALHRIRTAALSD